ncbi:MAG: hypothetical protein JWO51_1088 [Rhodospirillales bacterium]|nr:hypothetical protein [Rhodospirillales bacterium]
MSSVHSHAAKPPLSERQMAIFLKGWHDGLPMVRIAMAVGADLGVGEAVRSETALYDLAARLKLPLRLLPPTKASNGRPGERQRALMLGGFERGLSDSEVSELVNADLREGEFARSPRAMRNWRRKIAPPADTISTGIKLFSRTQGAELFSENSFEDDPRAVRRIGVTRFAPPASHVFGGSSIALCSEIG